MACLFSRIKYQTNLDEYITQADSVSRDLYFAIKWIMTCGCYKSSRRSLEFEMVSPLLQNNMKEGGVGASEDETHWYKWFIFLSG